jgi:AcrR family transcriptional regulator
VKKQAIKRAAARLFAERGVAAVDLSSVGMVAQLPSRGVNYYYRNREDLLGDILIDHVLPYPCRGRRLRRDGDIGAGRSAARAGAGVP